VAKYSVNLARSLGYSGDLMRLVEYAALLHDVGKIGVSDLILCKPDKLTDDEFAKMRSHPLHTLKILSEGYYPRALRAIPEVAACHHEKIDGSGYPRGLKGDALPQIARIIAVADIYDALVSEDRPYKRAVPREKSLAILKEEAQKSHLEAALVDTFIEKELYQL